MKSDVSEINNKINKSIPVPAPLGAGRAMRTQLLAVSVKISGFRQAAGPSTRRM